ncbi:MAG: ribonuclease PH [Alphaproteobacteria bacterium]|tara:strand:- start:2071 stop:2784 length:714 start_codon:yes stop_codon:yes gene_type:complete
MRKFNRKKDQIRDMVIDPNVNKNADGSCIIKLGNTHVICTASYESDVPAWLKQTNSGWLTAEYGMLPGSTSTRNKREAVKGKQSGRTVEIQRLIGRSLRTIINLKKLNGGQFILDCDVIQADGGTRTASISGAFVALSLAVKKLLDKKVLTENPIIDSISAISCGILDNEVYVDLDYSEDSVADVDANIILTKNSGISEVQASGEGSTFNFDQLSQMIEMTENAAKLIFEIQEKAIH